MQQKVVISHFSESYPKGGRIDILEAYEKILEQDEDFQVCVTCAAAAQNQIKVLEWVKERNLLEGRTLALKRTCRFGCLEAFKWLENDNDIYEYEELLTESAMHGQLGVVKYLSEKVLPEPESVYVIYMATACKNIEVCNKGVEEVPEKRK